MDHILPTCSSDNRITKRKKRFIIHKDYLTFHSRGKSDLIKFLNLMSWDIDFSFLTGYETFIIHRSGSAKFANLKESTPLAKIDWIYFTITQSWPVGHMLWIEFKMKIRHVFYKEHGTWSGSPRFFDFTAREYWEYYNNDDDKTQTIVNIQGASNWRIRKIKFGTTGPDQYYTEFISKEKELVFYDSNLKLTEIITNLGFRFSEKSLIRDFPSLFFKRS